MIEFEVLIDCSFQDLAKDSSLSTIDRKYCLSIANGFEDGHWQTNRFLNFIWDNVKDTALSKKERDALIGKESSLLNKAASNLRITEDDITGGEIAEILLYGVMKHHYNALPIVPKIFYKQNNNDYAKGADSVHIVIEGDKFSLWLGEAKFYSSLDNILDKVAESVHNTLSTDKIKKENAIITNLNDINEFGEISEKLRDDIFEKLCAPSIDELKTQLHIPILLLHQCSITSSATEFNADYIQKIKAKYTKFANSYFSKQIIKCADIFKYNDITFHLILFPVPDKEEIVEKFKNKANVFRN